jgi:hypothetical protein
MRFLLRIIALIALVGATYWIYRVPFEVEPYVTAISSLGGFLATFRDFGDKRDTHSHARPQIWLKAVGVNNLVAGEVPSILFEFQNVGDAHALELRVETGVYVSDTKLSDDPPTMVFASNPSTTFLPKNETMPKTLPFRRAVTADEVREIEEGRLFLYAYSALRYKGSGPNGQAMEHLLRTCSIYNPTTTYFQHTPFFNSTT